MTLTEEMEEIQAILPNCTVVLNDNPTHPSVVVVPPSDIDSAQFCDVVESYVKNVGLQTTITQGFDGRHYIESRPFCDCLQTPSDDEMCECIESMETDETLLLQNA